jgi:hypothetical protein
MTRALAVLIWLAAAVQVVACLTLTVPPAQLAVMIAVAMLATAAAAIATIDELRRH